MSFWSSQKLKINLPKIVSPYRPENVGSASYDLSLGDEAFISPLPGAHRKERTKELLGDGETLVIPPGQFAYLITQEKITIPDDAIGFINFKFKFKAKGLINVSGFHVDPGYSGHIIFATYNAGGSHFHVEKGKPLFSLWIADLDEIDEQPRRSKGYENIPAEILNVPDLATSLPQLEKRISKLESKIDRYSVKQAIIWVIVIGVSLYFIKGSLDNVETDDSQSPTPIVEQEGTLNRKAPPDDDRDADHDGIE